MDFEEPVWSLEVGKIYLHRIPNSFLSK